MNQFLQPTALFPFSVVVIAVVAVVSSAIGKTRKKELQFHNNLRIREMEHERKMKELEIELEEAKARSCTGQAAECRPAQGGRQGC